jgi:tRNA A-37 threonylcarbamoyl transferase component Bud32
LEAAVNIDNINIIEKYNSRRNDVYKVEITYNGEVLPAVMKQYSENGSCRACSNEYNRLMYFLQKDIAVPKPYGTAGNSLLMEYIPGVLINDLVERLEGGSWIGELALWFAKLHSIKENGRCLIKGDVNLRNFIFYEGKAYGLDFEEESYGDPMSDIADVCFFILTNRPSLTTDKDQIVRELLKEYCRLSGTAPGSFAEYLMKSRTKAKRRRMRG